MKALRLKPKIRVVAGHRIDTERLLLRQPVPADAADITRLLGSWQVAHWLVRVPYPYRSEHAAAWIERSVEERAAGIGWPFMIEMSEGGGVIGSIDILVEGGCGTLGYWLGEPYWGRGYIPEAIRAMMEFAFDILRLDVVDAQALVGNARSIRVLEKAGLAYAGRRVEDTVERGRVDVDYFAVRQADWRRAR